MLTGNWYSVPSLYTTLKNLENIENYIRTCDGGLLPIISAIQQEPVRYRVIQLQLEPVK